MVYRKISYIVCFEYAANHYSTTGRNRKSIFSVDEPTFYDRIIVMRKADSRNERETDGLLAVIFSDDILE